MSTELLDLLGIRADEHRVHWARTIRVGQAGTVTLVIDLDLHRLTDEDRDFLRGIGETLRALADREPQP